MLPRPESGSSTHSSSPFAAPDLKWGPSVLFCSIEVQLLSKLSLAERERSQLVKNTGRAGFFPSSGTAAERRQYSVVLSAKEHTSQFSRCMRAADKENTTETDFDLFSIFQSVNQKKTVSFCFVTRLSNTSSEFSLQPAFSGAKQDRLRNNHRYQLYHLKLVKTCDIGEWSIRFWPCQWLDCKPFFKRHWPEKRGGKLEYKGVLIIRFISVVGACCWVVLLLSSGEK